MTQVTYQARDLAFDRSWISAAALQVADALQGAGFDGYLVGGCVRDLLLQRRPKDFDITTNASPEQIKPLFRRSRIIGRRFKIVHVRFGREVIEVATYRAKPGRGGGPAAGRRQPIAHSGRVVDDNVFGTIEQDAARRDFTINSLYYDPNRERVLDFLGGVKDARKGVLRMIGDARERFTEDPVRMLRALRFRAKLGLALANGLQPAIADCLHLLDDVPAARLFDEVLKMFHYGHAVQSWRELRRHQLAERLFPLTAAAIADVAEDPNGHPDDVHDQSADPIAETKAAQKLIELALENTDHRVLQNKPVIPAFLFAVLLWMPYKHELARQKKTGAPSQEAAWQAGDVVFRRQARRVAVPRVVSAAVMEIWEMQFELERRRAKAVPRLLVERRFRAAFDFLTLRQRVGEVDEELARWWTDIQTRDPHHQQAWIEALRINQPAESRRRRRGMASRRV